MPWRRDADGPALCLTLCSDADGSKGDVNNLGSALLANAGERLQSLQLYATLEGSFGDAHATTVGGAFLPAEGAHVPGTIRLDLT